MNYFIGIDIGGTNCAVTLAGDDAKVILREEFSQEGHYKDVLEKISTRVDQFLRTEYSISAIGISCGGPLDSSKGIILSPPNLPGWDSVTIVDFMQTKYQLPTFLQNDANACALAEWKHGAGFGSNNFMFCTMGTGFGAGLILNEQLFEGANGNAGEIGHIRLTEDGPVGFGKKGSVEGYCGGSGIERLAKLRLGESYSAKELAMNAQKGDLKAIGVFNEVGIQLGKTLAITIDLLNLDTIVIGSIFERAEKLIRPMMQMTLKQECLPQSLSACKIYPAQLGDKIGDIAALTVAQNGFKNEYIK